MGVTYVGVGLVGSFGAYIVKGLTGAFGFRTCLMVMGGIVLLVWPITLLFVKNRPQDIGQNPDGAAFASDESKAAPLPFNFLTKQLAFWLLLIGSACSIGSIGSINQHMKFIFQDQGFTDQAARDAAWTTAQALILWLSIFGRLFIGWLADRYSKKYVMTATYVLVALTIPLAAARPPRQHVHTLPVCNYVRLWHGRRLHADPTDGCRPVWRQHAGPGHGDHPANRHDWTDVVPLFRG